MAATPSENQPGAGGLVSSLKNRRFHSGDKKGMIHIEVEASDQDIEAAAIQDTAQDVLTDEELQYYLSLADQR
jgi:hypothetical protein